MSFQTRLLPAGLDLTALCKTWPGKYPFALVSSASSKDACNGRYDIYFACPRQTLELDSQHRLINHCGVEVDTASGFLHAFDQWWKSAAIVRPRNDKKLPFTGGWFIYLAYELAGEIEPCLALPENRSTMPLALAVRCPAAIIVDHQRDEVIAVAENDDSRLLDEIEADCVRLPSTSQSSHPVRVTSIEEAEPAPYLEQVKRIKQYIRDGDIFQANLSRPWKVVVDADTDSVDLFRRLCEANPASFAALARLDQGAIISSSPERLVYSDGEQVQTRPIAGTRPRSIRSETDEALAVELLAHPKEQAEHIMLIDLERNDLGRICVPGSVAVSELMSLESYQHVHHIVSNVVGELRPGITPADIIRAVFPGGTITGCPKVRCMEILAEMERQPRGAYTGSLGYINLDGSMDLNILIRTMIHENESIHFRAGGGIVADSDPQHELEETRAKAKGMLNVFTAQDEACSV